MEDGKEKKEEWEVMEDWIEKEDNGEVMEGKRKGGAERVVEEGNENENMGVN